MDNGSPLHREDLLHLMSLKEVLDAFVHEIRQPLNVIMLACQVIRLKAEQTPLAADIAGFLLQRSDLISSQVRRATETLQGVSDFSKGLDSEEAPVDLVAVFREISDMMGQQFNSREIRLLSELGDGPLPVPLPSRITEGIVIQSLAFARDTVQAIGAWHRDRDFSYTQMVTATPMNKPGEGGLHLAWSTGSVPDGTFLIDPRKHSGLRIAASVLSARGGILRASHDSLRVVFLGSR
jgi:hypothetical protein